MAINTTGHDHAPEIDSDWEKYHEGWFDFICRRGEEVCEQTFVTEWDFNLFIEEKENHELKDEYEEREREAEEQTLALIGEESNRTYNEYGLDDFGSDETLGEAEQYLSFDADDSNDG